jgi:putative sulfotransferase
MTKNDGKTPAAKDGALILCSGRCGSTIVTDILGEHPGMLPILEFFYAHFEDGIPSGTPTGPEFWAMLNRPWRSLNAVAALGRIPAELRHKLADPAKLSGVDRTRASAYGGMAKGMSALLGFTLPAISDDPDGLLAELGQVVPDFPQQPLGDHYQQFFSLLTEVTGKEQWIEKSAGSGLYADELMPMFPQAKIVYLTRDVIDVVMSMSRHPMFQLAELRMDLTFRVGGDPYAEGFDLPASGLDPAVEKLLPSQLDASTLDERASSMDSLIRLTKLQAVMARQTERILDEQPAGKVLRLQYEKLLDHPYEELSRLGEFLGLSGCEQWARESSQRIQRPNRPYVKPDTGQQGALREVYETVYNIPGNPMAAFATT